MFTFPDCLPAPVFLAGGVLKNFFRMPLFISGAVVQSGEGRGGGILLQEGAEKVVDKLSPDTVADNVINVDFPLNHYAIQGPEFDTDFLVNGEGTYILMRYEETDPPERGVA
jgi:hypothetical protein